MKKYLLLLLLLSSCAIFDFKNAQDKVDIYENISYINESKNNRHLLDMFLPKNVKNFPVVIFVHGGYWNSQDKAYLRPFTGLYSNIGLTLAKNGIGSIVIDYRIYPEVKIEDEIKDVVNSIKWTFDNIKKYNGDIDNIFLSGHSAGGHMAMLIALNDKISKENNLDVTRIKGFIPISPVIDIKDMEKSNDMDFNNKTTYPVFGKNEEVFANYSPITYLKKDIPNMFIIYGEKDYPYLIKQNENAIKKLTELGSKFDYTKIKNYTHEDMVLKFGKDEDVLYKEVVNFVKK
ncbi:MAG: alpha/beta hydrolase [Candidatus Sericytochromatia bacterium]